MPNPGAVADMCLEQETSAAIASLPKEQQKDAKKLMDLWWKWRYTIPKAIMAMGVLVVFPVLLIDAYVSLIPAILVGISITIIICFYARRRRRRLTETINALIATNPIYWEPIQKTLEAAADRAARSCRII